MNDATKKIILVCALAFSIGAFILAFVVFKHQSAIVAYIQTMTLQDAQKQPVRIAPARVISSKSGNTWLDVQKQVKDTVVQVFSHVAEFNLLEPYKSPEQIEGAGSGFFINKNGDLITNYHVIAQSSSIEIQIPSFGLERFDVELIGVCPDRDIALLALTKDARIKIIKQLTKIPFLNLGDSDQILRSQEVLALGYPLGQSRLKSTLGIVSGRERLGRSGFIQITAPLNPGNSGGPALTTNGEVIGINTGAVMEAQNVGYIIPINEVKSALKDLYKVKLLRKPTLGCIFTAATPEMVKYLGNPADGGWYIAKVFNGTLLENVGVKEGDMLYEINGYRVDMYGDINVPWSEDKASLFEFLNRLTVGDTINFVIYRKGTRKKFSFTFEHKYLAPVRMIYPEFEKDEIDYEIIGGLVVMPLSLNHIARLISNVPDLVRYGKDDLQHEKALILTHVFPNSQAFKARVLRSGEIIEEVNGEKVKTLADFRRAILKSKQTRYITLHTDDSYYVVLSVDKIIAEENILAARYFFEPSRLLEQLKIQKAPMTASTNKKTESANVNG
jgi:serine protease Do